MIKIIPYASLGNLDHGWLNARHHFSFASYHDRARMGFGVLRVINDDIIATEAGFGTHPHKDMEIITYVRKGAISHKDSMGNEGRTKAGDVQVMSAGTGVFHSEYNAELETTNLYQIWIIPNQKNVEPRWDSREFPKTPVSDKLPVLVSGMAEHKGENVLFIYQDAAIYGGKLAKGAIISQPIKHQAYILASDGTFYVNDMKMDKGDGAEVVAEPKITISASSDADILLIDVPEI